MCVTNTMCFLKVLPYVSHSAAAWRRSSSRPLCRSC